MGTLHVHDRIDAATNMAPKSDMSDWPVRTSSVNSGA
jgi:hypothetical protein